ncbi:MAG: DHH family phosphoesterase [Clostridia bacterium]
MKRKNGYFNFILKNTPFLYFMLVILFGIWMCFFNLFAGIVLIALSIAMTLGVLLKNYLRMENMEKYFSSMTQTDDKFDVTRGVMVAMVAVSTDGKITWWNDVFEEICPTVAMHDGITTHISAITMDTLCKMQTGEEKRIEHNNRCYMMVNVPFKADNASDSAFVITLSDITEKEQLKKMASDGRTVVAHILIDNYDELVTDDGNDASYQAEKEIEKLVFDWGKNLGGSIRRMEKGKYLCILNAGMLEKIKASKFDILEKVKTLGGESVIEPTLSIGVGIDGADINEIDFFAKTALDMALGRGGDQAVVKDGNNFTYYGGKSRETEKRTKVKARIKALALVSLIDECENVIVMGHNYADADAFGSSVALACVAMARGKQAKVLIETYDSTVKYIMRNFEKNQTHWSLFVNKMQARELVREKTLVIVCDTHRRSLVASTEVLDMAETVVLIDHHRRSEDFITNTDLTYHEPSASSTCEMITEMFQYIGRSGINSEVAEAIYAGILVDTNDFIYKTGVRTFEAVAYLKKLGADTVNIKKCMKETMEAYNERARIVSSVEVYKNGIGISKVYTETEAQEVLAKAANDILNLEGITVSFVIAPTSTNAVSISGRSYGDFNVQVICEMLGGGGHMLAGAVRIEDCDVDKAEEMLMDALKKYE